VNKSTDYAEIRPRFGFPIAKNRAISFQLADIATEIAPARFIYYHAVSLADNGKSFSTNAAMAKLYASELAMRASTGEIQIFRGYGYMMEYPMQR
jgi:alkylation response protein AidB-like acyl-CoA dehydrogenase